MFHPFFYSKDIDWKFESRRSIEYRDPLHWNSTRRKTNSISNILKQFLITRTIFFKTNWIQLQVKKKNFKKAFMESKIVIMIKFGSKDDNFICEDINDTLTACGGDVTFWKLKKFWYSTDNQSTVVITIYRECYDIKKKGKDFVFYYYFFNFNLELCFKLRLFSRDNSWFWYWRKL